MKSLQIYKRDKLEVNSANARELHLFLETTSNFAEWISRRITQYGFIENQDYITEFVYTKGRPKKEYYITLDMAKELSMVENNEKGKQARQYFIKCEKELQAIKTNEYVNKIANLKAINLKTGRHLQNVRNGYLSQISQKNKKIDDLKLELAKKPKTITKVVYKKEVYKPKTVLEADFIEYVKNFKKGLNVETKNLFDEMVDEDLKLHFIRFMFSVVTDIKKFKLVNKNDYFKIRLDTIEKNKKYNSMWVKAHINNKF